MAWLIDDGRLEDSDLVYRRFPRLPDFYTPRDAVTGKAVVTNAALQYDVDGMSVYSARLMAENHVAPSDLYKPQKQGLSRVTAGHVRRSGLGLIVEPDLDDENVGRGQSHCLVRISAPKLDKRVWTTSRLELRKGLEVFDEQTESWGPVV